MNQRIENYIDMLHRAHCDNSEQVYYARKMVGRPRLTMPVTSFIYEFFLYNSIYQYDWETTFDTGQLVVWPKHSEVAEDKGMSESQQQTRLEKFLKLRCKDNDVLLGEAFGPLGEMEDLQADWTKVKPDERISLKEGSRFFRKLSELSQMIKDAEHREPVRPTKRVFDLIKECRYFVYNVRNNIFHGSKSLGETYESNQRRRIEAYDLFLKCLTSLFFLATGKKPVASHYVQLPVTVRGTGSRDLFVGKSEILDATISGWLKPEDSRLIRRVQHMDHSTREVPGPNSSLFYPSAGRDLITPLLLGLSSCRHFFFYERSSSCRVESIRGPLARLLGFRTKETTTNPEEEHILTFEFGKSTRYIHWVHKDNMDFLNRDKNLCFYFHRGDSLGEGGSGQKWDSELMNRLLDKVPEGGMCRIVTDGCPGGFRPDLEKISEKMRIVEIPSRQQRREKTYYSATLNADQVRQLRV